MTLQIEPPTTATGGDLVPGRSPAGQLARTAKPAREPLDRFARRAYASAAIGALLAATAAAVLRIAHLSLTSKIGHLILCLLALGAVMCFSGASVGSVRPRQQLGGDR